MQEDEPVVPRLIVKFADLDPALLETLFDVRIDSATIESTVADHPELANLLPWNILLQEFRDFSFATLYPSMSFDAMRETFGVAQEEALGMVDENGAPIDYDIPNPLRFFRLDFAPGRERATLEELPARLTEGNDNVTRVYFDSPPVDPPALVAYGNDPLVVDLDYLTTHQVRYAWTKPGGDGAGVGVVDLEQGWEFAHEDLPAGAALIRLVSGENKPTKRLRLHGAAALGILNAVDNNKGIIGVVPSATVMATSQWRFDPKDPTKPSTNNIADALWSLVDATNPSLPTKAGDVIIIEAQSEFTAGGVTTIIPVEMLEHNNIAVLTATVRGRVVVEAAGNGDDDLDALAASHPGELATKQTYAIVVGAGSRDARGWTRWRQGGGGLGRGTNYGSRVDCFAAGDAIKVIKPYGTGYGAARYATRVGGTSAATAIVGGIVASLQGIALAGTPSHWHLSWKIRSWLRDPGNPGAISADQRIGRLPDMRHIIDTFAP